LKANSPPIRLLIIISSFAIEGPQGGAERFAIELAARLDPSRFDVTVCGLWYHELGYEQKWMDYLFRRGVQAITTTAWTGSTYRDARASLKFLRKYVAGQPSFDIVNSHAAFADLAAIWIRLLGKTGNLVRTLHSEREWYRRPQVGIALNHFIAPLMFQTEVAVSRKITADLNQRPLARLLGRQAHVYYNAIDRESLSHIYIDVTAKKRSLGLDPDTPIIGNVARFTKQKGHTYFLDMAATVLQKYPRCQFLLIGIGELLPAIKEKAQRLGISENIHFLGARTDVAELLPIMDIFVSSSLWEGLPTVILEAMVAGVPVVATEVSGSVELVQNNSNGLLVPPANAQSLSEAVFRLLDDPDLSSHLVENASYFVKNFDIDKITSDYEMLFCRICE
jgi:glycosyltransferase involved in cell wall biosynthesis